MVVRAWARTRGGRAIPLEQVTKSANPVLAHVFSERLTQSIVAQRESLRKLWVLNAGDTGRLSAKHVLGSLRTNTLKTSWSSGVKQSHKAVIEQAGRALPLASVPPHAPNCPCGLTRERRLRELVRWVGSSKGAERREAAGGRERHWGVVPN